MTGHALSDTLVVQAIHELTAQIKHSASVVGVQLGVITLLLLMWPRNRR